MNRVTPQSRGAAVKLKEGPFSLRSPRRHPLRGAATRSTSTSTDDDIRSTRLVLGCLCRSTRTWVLDLLASLYNVHVALLGLVLSSSQVSNRARGRNFTGRNIQSAIFSYFVAKRTVGK